MFSADRYVEAMRYAAARHNAQKVPGSDLPYLVHLVAVTAEVIAVLPVAGLARPDLAVTCALLHDTVEDTGAELDDLRDRFGEDAAAGVAALTKNRALSKPEQMPDSLRRILAQPAEIAVVKLADRITNLAAPPRDWSRQKCAGYRAEALTIVDALGERCPALDRRLRARIEAYQAYC